METNEFGNRIMKVENYCGRCWHGLNIKDERQHCRKHHKIIAHILNEGDSLHYYPRKIMEADLYVNMDTENIKKIYTVKWKRKDVIPNEETTTE